MATLWIRHYEHLHLIFKMLGEFGLGSFLLQLTWFMKTQWSLDFVLKYESMFFLSFCVWHCRFFSLGGIFWLHVHMCLFCVPPLVTGFAIRYLPDLSTWYVFLWMF